MFVLARKMGQESDPSRMGHFSCTSFAGFRIPRGWVTLGGSLVGHLGHVFDGSLVWEKRTKGSSLCNLLNGLRTNKGKLTVQLIELSANEQREAHCATY